MERQNLETMKVVAGDPGMSDLLFMVDNDKKERNTLRYSQNTRHKETKVKKYLDILKEKKESYMVEGMTVVEWETDMSIYY